MSEFTNSEELNAKLKLLHGTKQNFSVQLENDMPYASDLIFERNGWLQRFTKHLFYVVFAMVIVAVVITITLLVVSGREPIALSYAMDANNNIVVLEPTNEKTVTEEDVLSFAIKKTKQFHKLSFTDYADYVTSLENEFTTHTAFENYQKALLASKTIERIISERQVSWAEPLSAPRIIDFDENTVSWIVEMNFRWFLGGGEFTTTGSDMRIVFEVNRVSRNKNLAGIAIGSYLIKEKGTSNE